MSDEFYDEDGFRLEFEDDTVDQEKQFFMRAFPNVNKIADRKVHCTSCYMHIGTAPITEAVIRMHPILRVTHCRNCHTFYNSGEFDKGEDGSELYCRWCGQGGEVYCCSKCPYVFCKKCIVQNLSRACVQDISRNDNWQCFSCAPKIMWHLRAQHWALVNYIEKQKKDMKDKNLSVQTINNLMKQDNTTCCSNKGLNKKGGTPVLAKKGATKRPADVSEITSPGAAKIPDNKRVLPRPMMTMQQSPNAPPAAKKAKPTDNNEVVCTPDIMSMFMSPEEPPPLVATRSPPVAKPPPPVVKPPITKPMPPQALPMTVPGRQVVVRPAMPPNANPVTMRMPLANQQSAIPPPVYHTINGYRIDLHTAAQQGTYRLPNGKLIQVRKQAPAATPAPVQPPNITVSRNIAPKPQSAYFNPGAVGQGPPTRMANGGSNMHINLALQQQQQLQEQRLQQQRQQQQQQQMLQQRQQQLMLQAQAQAQAQAGQPQPTIVAGQPNPALQLPTLVMLQNMVNGQHEDSPLGKSRKNFEGKLLSGVEICQHIVNKINTLTNSNSFKNIRNVRDLKELYIHVSYLLTYAIGRFKTLQEKCVDDVKKMGFTKESDFVMMGDQISNRNPDEDKSDDEDDCEIVEQNTTLIELDSDDEDEGKKKKDDGANKSAPCPIETEAAVAAILQEKDDVSSSCEVISVDSVPQISLVEGNVSLDKIGTTDAEKSSENSATEESTQNASVEVTEPEKSKNDDDLVEIIDGDESATPKDDTDKAENSTGASKDASDIVEIIEADEDEEQLQKEADEAAVEEKKDSTDEEKMEQASEEKQPEKEADKVEVEKTKEVVDGDKEEHAVDEKQESAETAPEESEKTSKEVEDVEMSESVEAENPAEAETSTEAETLAQAETPAEAETPAKAETSAEAEKSAEEEKPAELETIDVSKGVESKDKENETPEVNSEEAENTVATEKEADKEELQEESEKLAESEQMEVCAQKEDEVKSSSAVELPTQEEEKPDEHEDAPVSTEPENEKPVAVADSEPEANQTKDSAPVEESVHEAEEPRDSDIDPLFLESVDESHSADPAEDVDASVESTVEDTADVAEDAEHASEAPSASEEESSEESHAVELISAPTEDDPEDLSAEEILPIETTEDEYPAAEEAPEAQDPVDGESPVEDIPDLPTGNELLTQIEDSFQKLQELIDSTEDVTEESNDQQPTEAETPLGDEQMEVDDDATAGAPADADSSPAEVHPVALAQSADDTASNDVSMVDDEGSIECNGVLEENGTTSSGESRDAPEKMLISDMVPTAIGKTTSADIECVNSPEEINGDC